MFITFFDLCYLCFFHSILRNLSVGCASSCGDTSTQLIASTSLSSFLCVQTFYVFIVSLTSSSSIYSVFVILFKRSFLLSRCLCFTFLLTWFWFYTSLVLFMLIIFWFTHSTFFWLRYNLDLLCWHCCHYCLELTKSVVTAIS